MLSQEEDRMVRDAFENLLKQCPRCQSKENEELVRKAFSVAHNAHIEKRRKTGEPFIMHPIAVAHIVVNEIGLGTTSVVCALLHDVVEDCEDYTVGYIKELFGEKVASIIDGLTKIDSVQGQNTNTQLETIKKMLLTIPQDLRVIFIKLADRLHNMRTLHGMPRNKQLQKAGETLHVYSPIAHRLGLYNIKKELEDLAFQYRQPEDYEQLLNTIQETEVERGQYFEDFTRPIREILKKNNLEFYIYLKKRSLYSTWKEMEEKQIPFQEIYNYAVVRIVFKTEEEENSRTECYSIYALITELFPPNEQVVDWLLRPQSTGFKALVANLMGNEGKWVEVQILTEKMNEISEKGVYDAYETEDAEQQSENVLDKWINEVSAHLKNPEANAAELLDMVTLDLFASEIYVFSPKGDIYSMPKGSTILDFAFMVHTDLGLHCIAGKVNREPVGRNYVLKSSDQIHILTSKNQMPDESWLDIVITSRAKASLKVFLKRQQSHNIKLGRDSFRALLKDNELSISSTLMDHLLSFYDIKKEGSFFSKLGQKLIKEEDVIKILKSRSSKFKISSILPNIFSSKNSETGEVQGQIEVEFNPKKPFVIQNSLDDSIYKLADCCRPIPGDDCIAYKTSSGFIMIHKTNCAAAIKLNAEQAPRTAHVKWLPLKDKLFPSRLKLQGVDRSKILQDVVNTISNDYNAEFMDVDLHSEDGVFKGELGLLVRNITDLNNIKSALKKINQMAYVQRIEKF